MDMQYLNEAKAEGWISSLDSLRKYVKTHPRQSWAFEHVYMKAKLMALDHQIGSGDEWNSEDSIKPV